MLSPGDPAPDFEVLDHRGQTVRLSEHRGKTIVLWFYPKADTPGWTIEGCGFRDLYPEFLKKNAEIWGVSFDTVAENADFATKFDYPFPLLSDTRREIGLAYGAADSPDAGFAKRITYVIGPGGKILQAHPRVEPKAHPKAILESL